MAYTRLTAVVIRPDGLCGLEIHSACSVYLSGTTAPSRRAKLERMIQWNGALTSALIAYLGNWLHVEWFAACDIRCFRGRYRLRLQSSRGLAASDFKLRFRRARHYKRLGLDR